MIIKLLLKSKKAKLISLFLFQTFLSTLDGNAVRTDGSTSDEAYVDYGKSIPPLSKARSAIGYVLRTGDDAGIFTGTLVKEGVVATSAHGFNKLLTSLNLEDVEKTCSNKAPIILPLTTGQFFEISHARSQV